MRKQKEKSLREKYKELGQIEDMISMVINDLDALCTEKKIIKSCIMDWHKSGHLDDSKTEALIKHHKLKSV